MARQPPRREKNRVGAQRVIHRPRIRGEPATCSLREAAVFLRRDGDDGVIDKAARFYFDENDRAAALRDNVDLAAMRPEIARQNLIEPRPQPQRRRRLGAKAVDISGAAGVAVQA